MAWVYRVPSCEEEYFDCDWVEFEMKPAASSCSDSIIWLVLPSRFASRVSSTKEVLLLDCCVGM